MGERPHSHFWRAYGGAEVDYLEVAAGGALQSYEFKYGSGGARAGGRAFERAYGAGVRVINQNNYLDFALGTV